MRHNQTIEDVLRPASCGQQAHLDWISISVSASREDRLAQSGQIRLCIRDVDVRCAARAVHRGAVLRNEMGSACDPRRVARVQLDLDHTSDHQVPHRLRVLPLGILLLPDWRDSLELHVGLHDKHPRILEGTINDRGLPRA